MPSLLISFLVAALAAVPVALVWGVVTTLAVAFALTHLLWPLMAVARGLVDGLIQILRCLPPQLLWCVRSNHGQGEHEHQCPPTEHRAQGRQTPLPGDQDHHHRRQKEKRHEKPLHPGVRGDEGKQRIEHGRYMPSCFTDRPPTPSRSRDR